PPASPSVAAADAIATLSAASAASTLDACAANCAKSKLPTTKGSLPGENTILPCKGSKGDLAIGHAIGEFMVCRPACAGFAGLPVFSHAPQSVSEKCSHTGSPGDISKRKANVPPAGQPTSTLEMVGRVSNACEP